MPATMAFASTTQLRRVLSDIVNSEGQSFALECQTPREATLLRGRLNKLRSLDRDQMRRLYAEQKIPVGETASLSSYDELIFRVVDSDVVVEKAPLNDEEILALVRPAGEPRRFPPGTAPEASPEPLEVPDAPTRPDDTPLRAEDLEL